jgi:hypothetical protein
MKNLDEEVEVPVWFCLLIVLVLTSLLFLLLYMEGARMKEERQQELRDCYSPMSTDPEIQEAYDEVRPDPYIRGTDTFAMETP